MVENQMTCGSLPEDEKPIFKCIFNGCEGILEGDKYYNCEDGKVCEEHILDYLKQFKLIAEREDQENE